jgi:hypothetical protein
VVSRVCGKLLTSPPAFFVAGSIDVLAFSLAWARGRFFRLSREK